MVLELMKRASARAGLALSCCHRQWIVLKLCLLMMVLINSLVCLHNRLFVETLCCGFTFRVEVSSVGLFFGLPEFLSVLKQICQVWSLFTDHLITLLKQVFALAVHQCNYLRSLVSVFLVRLCL